MRVLNANLTILGNNRIQVSGNCRVTGKLHSVVVPMKGLEDYELNDYHIQNAFPDTPAEDREFIQSGISPEGWLRTFPKENE